MAQSVFGVGFLFATPQGANPTPTRFGRLQDVGVDFSYDSKLLYGSNQYALEQARGKAKIELKAAVGVVDPALFNNVFFGLTTTTSSVFPMLIVNGPSRDDLGIDYRASCMGGAAGRGSMRWFASAKNSSLA